MQSTCVKILQLLMKCHLLSVYSLMTVFYAELLNQSIILSSFNMTSSCYPNGPQFGKSSVLKMKFNVSKFVLIRCSWSPSLVQHNYHLDNHSLDVREEHSYLGVLLNKSLSTLQKQQPKHLEYLTF